MFKLLTIIAFIIPFGNSQIYDLTDLNIAINKGHLQHVGFLSEGNYHSVEHELSNTAIPVIFEDMQHLETAIDSGEVIAGLVSGHPDSKYTKFGSKQTSPRTVFLKKGNDLVNVMDAAISRYLYNGGIETAKLNNPPFEALIVHTCPSADAFEWPDIGNKSEIKIASLGPYDWGNVDGNYTGTDDQFKGFWVDVYKGIEKEIYDQYGIKFKRFWYASSTNLLESLNKGDTDASEPYYMFKGKFKGLSRKTAFESTCVIAATTEYYFVKKFHQLNQVDDKLLDTTSIILMATFIPVICSLLIIGVYMYKREKKGKPLFNPLLVADEVCTKNGVTLV